MMTTSLGIKDSRFTVNGRPTFLLGISYYGGLGASDALMERDLDEIRAVGCNWIRVWATWFAFGNNVSAVDAEGNPREPFFGKLKHLIEQCNRRGMIVDVTLSRGNGVSGGPRLQSIASHIRAVEALATRLRSYRNWYLDLGNERNIKDARFVSVDDLRQLREAVLRIDPDRIVTASHAGDISTDELRDYLFTVRVDCICPHRPRNPDSPAQTESQSREYLDHMKKMGRVVPLHYQEPFRREFGGWQPKAPDFLTDLRGAISGQSAGWCLHNGDNRDRPDGVPRRSFDLREKRMFDQFDDEERKVVEQMKTFKKEEDALPQKPRGATEVSIRGDSFYINGRPTYAGRTWNGHRIEGLLMNSRMVQGIFDDLNTQTRSMWNYPDTRVWDPERNTKEFIDAMPEWRRHGLLAFTINLQGGSPQGYSREQPWHNSAIKETGELREDYMTRLERIIDRADDLGMAVILGVFYFGQDQRIRDEASVVRALDNAIEWVFSHGYRNVLIEINNECNVRYDHPILQPERVHELIERVKGQTHNGRRLLVSVSYGGGTIPRENVVRSADFLLLHGNGVSDPNRIAKMVRDTRMVSGYRPMPILFNEDDHFDFDKPRNNMLAAIGEYCSWGYFDPGENNYRDGYQCPPVNWWIDTDRKKAFFKKVNDVTGALKG